ncbi:hypothetical protein GH714_041453 [Hevea brasiliensis]|uniref:Protein kinase domain-containing protein n=1 Tax=Hevea brasiliensis TaxID=3981 RepID=A0A6A6MYB4_HEVBR|nr:hypothetical protein GH714_041453 [Hevea brasiliensis]
MVRAVWDDGGRGKRIWGRESEDTARVGEAEPEMGPWMKWGEFDISCLGQFDSLNSKYLWVFEFQLLLIWAIPFVNLANWNLKNSLEFHVTVLAANLSLNRGRKLLQKQIAEQSKSHDIVQDIPLEEKKNDPTTFSTPKQVGLVATRIVVMGCGLLCPCFYRKRKATTHSVLAKDLNSMDSVSSLDVNSGPEKVPPSPLRVPPSPSRFSMSPKLTRLGSIHLNLNQVTRATHNFSPSLRIGEGGFGTVYKAQLEDGQMVAIKRAKKEHYEKLRTEFSSEVELLAKIDHRNLVKLLGFVDQGNERLIITEYVPNGSLRVHLDGQRGKILDFNQRLEISIDVAHALTYLHTYAG